MNDLKYLIWVPPGFDEIRGARAIIFNGLINHSDMVPPEGEVIRGGFIRNTKTRDIDKMICHGKSESLGVESNKAMDTMIVRATLTGTHTNINYIKAHKKLEDELILHYIRLYEMTETIKVMKYIMDHSKRNVIETLRFIADNDLNVKI